MKTRSELTDDVKKTFYDECLGITSVAVCLFILTQERAMFDEDNDNEIINSKVIKKTAKEDMQIIKPIMKAIRTNDIKAMMNYEDIMINLDELMLNHKRDTELEGRIRKGFKERQNTLDYKRRDLIESLSVEISALGIFDSLNVVDIKKIVTKIIKNNPIDTELNIFKSDAIQQAITLNQQKKVKKESKIQKVELLPLLAIRTKAMGKKQHPYELLKTKDYVKQPLKEFYLS